MPTKTYKDLAPGDYAANLNGTEKTITVAPDGTYRTSDADEQYYFEFVLGRTASAAKAEQAKEDKV